MTTTVDKNSQSFYISHWKSFLRYKHTAELFKKLLLKVLNLSWIWNGNLTLLQSVYIHQNLHRSKQNDDLNCFSHARLIVPLYAN